MSGGGGEKEYSIGYINYLPRKQRSSTPIISSKINPVRNKYYIKHSPEKSDQFLFYSSLSK